MTDLDTQISLASTLMRNNRRCAEVLLVRNGEVVTKGFVCKRMRNHSGDHDYEDVTTTIPLNWRSNGDA